MTTYVSHTCHNSRLKLDNHNYCDRAFMDVDTLKTKMFSPNWKYCPECEKKGFKNPVKKILSQKRNEQMEKMRLSRLKNVS